MIDPRNDNCKAYHVTNGMVDGVELKYIEKPGTKYQLTYVELIPEARAGGNTTATFDVKNSYGDSTAQMVYLCYPAPDYPNRIPTGNPNKQHMIVNGYDAAAGQHGPLAMFPLDNNNQICGDIIDWLGLPNNRHVCYQMTWRERSAAPDPEPEPDNNTNVLLLGILTEIQKLNVHLGVK